MVVYWAVRLRATELSFNLDDSLAQPALDLRHSRAFSEVTGVVEVLEISAQFQQELLGKTAAHRRIILHKTRFDCKITRFYRRYWGWASPSFVGTGHPPAFPTDIGRVAQVPLKRREAHSQTVGAPGALHLGTWDTTNRFPDFLCSCLRRAEEEVFYCRSGFRIHSSRQSSFRAVKPPAPRNSPNPLIPLAKNFSPFCR
jgi:hypothetical protein